MEDGTLAVMVPLMIRALRERSTIVNRRASVIIENMSKLVSLLACEVDLVGATGKLPSTAGRPSFSSQQYAATW